MKYILKGIGYIFTIIFLSIFIIINYPYKNSKTNNSNKNNVKQFVLDNSEIIYNNLEQAKSTTNSGNTKSETSPAEVSADSKDAARRQEILNKAKAMVEVKWTPKHNLTDQKTHFVFVKGKTYTGIPYSMGGYQAASPEDFLKKISSANQIYGNDCSGFISAVWGIKRQTTLSLLNAVKNKQKIDGKSVIQIAWEELKSGDALLLDNGKGKGHIVLYISTDDKDSDKMNVYEQNIPTIIPYEPIPAARQDVRYKSTLKKQGYIPIRLVP